MTFRDVARRYLGWCPGFNTDPTRTIPIPISSLSNLDKVIVAITLASWGLFSIFLYTDNPILYDTIRYGANQSQAVLYTIQAFLSVASGTTLFVLLVDFVITQRVLRRHRLELFTILSFQALNWFVTPFDLILRHIEGTYIGNIETLIMYNFAFNISEALLFGYLAYRVISNKSILSRNLFPLLSMVFAVPVILEIGTLYLFSVSQDPLGWMNRGLFLLVYLFAAIYCLNIYVKSRGKTGYDLTLPIYARAMVFLYGLTHSGVFSFLLTGEAKYLLFISGNTGRLVYLPYFVFFLGLMAVSFMPLKFRVGEITSTIQEAGE